MAYCGPLGLPLSEFLQWHPDDQSYALGWQAQQHAKCPGCGTSDWEWEADRDAYQAEPWVCQGCMRIEQAKKDHKDTAEHLPGLTIRLMRGGEHGGQAV